MSVAQVVELVKERGVSGKYRETFNYTRTFLVKTSSPATSLVAISQAPGVDYLQGHPDDGTCVAQEFDCQCADDSGLFYKVVVKYFAPPNENKDAQDPPSGFILPPDVWSASASIQTGPCTKDKDGNAITNAAKDPIGDLEMDHAEYRLTLVRCYPNLSWGGLAVNYTNAVNNATWNGQPARSWKCHFQNAQKVIENNKEHTLVYWTVTWDFAFRKETWDLKEGCLNVGTMELVDGKKKPIKVNGETVTEPVALTNAGAKAADGTVPTVCNSGNGFRVYRELDFSGFGTLS